MIYGLAEIICHQIADALVDAIEGYKRARHATELSGDLYFFKFQVLSNTEKNWMRWIFPRRHKSSVYLVGTTPIWHRILKY